MGMSPEVQPEEMVETEEESYILLQTLSQFPELSRQTEETV